MQLVPQHVIDLGAPESPEQFEEYFELRWQLLRSPLGAPRGTERDALEIVSEHVTARDREGRLVGIGRLHMNAADEAQIRYMATVESWRRRGVGRAVAERLEAIARARGADRIVLDARKDFVAFYLALGYEVEGPGPTKFGTLEHSRMSKRLGGA